ncbi:MAG: hypothetical protein ACFFEW_16540, partial [Candidatus Thorarchaeota archaeon]
WRRGLVLLAIMILVSSSMFFPVSAASVPEQPETMKEQNVRPVLVHIYYDSSVEKTTSMIPYTREALVENSILVESFDVENILQLEVYLNGMRPDYAVYYFESSQEGVEIRGDFVTWERLADSIGHHPYIKHIFGMGSAYVIKDYLGDAPNLFTDDSDVLDISLGRLFAIWTIADTLSSTNTETWRETGEDLRETALRDFSDNINEYFSKGIIPEEYTGERVPKPITDPNLTDSWIVEEKQQDDEGRELSPLMRLGIPAEVGEDYIALKEMSIESGIGGPIGWLIDTVLSSLIDLGFQDLAIHQDAAEEINQHFVDLVNESRYEIQAWFNEEGFNMTDLDFTARVPELLPRQMFELWSRLEELILDSWYDVDHYIGEFFERVINTPVQTDLAGLVPVFLFRLGTPINLGSNFASFGAVLRVKLLPDFEIDREPFETFMRDSIMGDFDLASISDVEEAFIAVREFIDVIPVMDIEFAICAFLPTGNDWAQGLMGQFTIDFFGHAWMQLAFPSLDATNTERSFIDVRSWGFRFELDANFALSISAFLAPGPGGVISTILDWFSELLSVTITVTLSIVFEISKMYQGQGLPALSTILFDIIIGVTLDIRILVVVFKGTLQVGLRFEQQSGILEEEPLLMVLAENPSPIVIHTLSDIATSTVGVYITLYASLYFAIDLFFTSFGTHFGGPWTTTFDISDTWGSSTYGEEAADLTDTDRDGLPDDFETTMSAAYLEAGYILAADGFFLNPASADTDSDGLNDKLELELNTKPHEPDSDLDLLTDYQEHMEFLTDPLLPDTDRDNLTDYQEVMIYGTSPFIIDTDGDMLYDWYEINTVYDITYTAGTYGAVDEVEIGGMIYNDRTDPLNPDTDLDGLLDGEEWENGVMYLNETELGLYQYAHYQYTHPLDADTDDDSLAWLWTGEGWGVNPFAPTDDVIWDMSDGVEVLGQIATIPDAEGFPEVKLVKTNPVYLDTDNDTAWGAVFLYRTDGYELSLDPQNDPTNGDEDSDGLKDGYEAIGPGGSGTSPQNPDTDNDHLPDYEDFMLETDPRKPDSDDDMVLDGDEYFLFGTNPLLNDTDFDGLTDGEELYFFYSNPLVRDSDIDGLTDGEEVLIYNTDPLHKDTDRDMLEDGYEVFVSETNPILWDTDQDWLGDGEELLIYNSNPLDWDTDHDSLDYPNEFGDMTLPLSDGMEVLVYGTSPTEIDTDSDGLLDSQEIYLAQGFPGQDPIALDPLNPDSDFDTLPDGLELILRNVSIITYPYEALIMELRYNSNPALNDTDGDNLTDDLEVQYNTYADDPDSDDDLLSDYFEIFVTHSDPLSNDTDGDEIPDNLESWEGIMANTTPSEAMEPPFLLAQGEEEHWVYPTDINDPDTDDDYLPDGLELVYGTNPLEWDENENGIADGFEYDFDEDGLSDGEEFYLNQTWMMELPIGNNSHGIWHWTASPGGFDNPDSDMDGISDGLEVHTYGTSPTSGDTDGDGISDMDEIALGGDPIIPITKGLPSWVLPAVAGAGAFIVGLVAVPGLRWTFGKIGGFRARRKRTAKKLTKRATATSKKTTRSTKKKPKEDGTK